MSNFISSRTPEGVPNTCPLCHSPICIEPSQPSGDAPCPRCGALLWFIGTEDEFRYYDSAVIGPIREKILQLLCDNLGVNRDRVSEATSFEHEVGVDSLDIVELVMELEEEFGVVVTDEDAEKIRTVRDAIEYLARRGL
jgi:acyl carrier protein